METFDTEIVDPTKVQQAITKVFDLRLAAITRDLDLLRPICARTAAYGHFGCTDVELPWERTDRADALKSAVSGQRSADSREVLVRIAVTGSIAIDHLMKYPGRFADRFLADEPDNVSLSFLVDRVDIRRGGVAANIAYGLDWLGMKPIPVGAVSADHDDYRSWLERHGVDTKPVMGHGHVRLPVSCVLPTVIRSNLRPSTPAR